MIALQILATKPLRLIWCDVGGRQAGRKEEGRLMLIIILYIFLFLREFWSCNGKSTSPIDQQCFWIKFDRFTKTFIDFLRFIEFFLWLECLFSILEEAHFSVQWQDDLAMFSDLRSYNHSFFWQKPKNQGDMTSKTIRLSLEWESKSVDGLLC